MDDPILDIKQEIENATHYVCGVGDLDKPLPDDIKKEFQGLFYLDFDNKVQRRDAWRMFYQNRTPDSFLARYGIDINHPTVRDAVAFDLVKLDDGSVSNNVEYLYPEHVCYSPMEYERWLLNRNYRINLVNLENEWSEVRYGKKEPDIQVGTDVFIVGDDEPQKVMIKRTVQKEYQGCRLSDNLLGYFSYVMGRTFGEDGNPVPGFDFDQLHDPCATHNDFTQEIALIPNTHPNFPAITSRAYYDRKHARYFGKILHNGFSMVSTFALVDVFNDKNHTGEFLVKFQRRIDGGKYQYLVAKLDMNGQLGYVDEGQRFRVWTSGVNEILSVCEQDFLQRGQAIDGVEAWSPEVRDVPMVHSTTSSEYSVFEQRIPDYELKDVRNYLQFKTRLEGMNRCLVQLKRNAKKKEVQVSECFANLTIEVARLVGRFSDNRELVNLIVKYYQLMHEWDSLEIKKCQLGGVHDEKVGILNQLLAEYNSIEGNEIDRKISLGSKIRSLKLEINKQIDGSISGIDRRLEAIILEVQEINRQIDEIYEGEKSAMDGLKPQFHELVEQVQKQDGVPKPGTKLGDIVDEYNRKANEIKQRFSDESGQSKVDSDAVSDLNDHLKQHVENFKEESGFSTKPAPVRIDRRSTPQKPDLTLKIDTFGLQKCIHQTEKWNWFFFNLSYELSQMKEMLVPCQDATIKVARLLRNFVDRIKETEKQVWDENHQLREDFNFGGITSSGIRDIILLHDWYACNAPNLTFSDLGFATEDEFVDFRKRCNEISYNLRKNQYATSLKMKADRTQTRIQELTDILSGSLSLKWDDKYGKDAEFQTSDDWSLDKVGSQQIRRIKVFVEAEESIAGQMKGVPDSTKVMEKTYEWMKDIGLVDKPEDVDGLVVRNLAMGMDGRNFMGDLEKLEKRKDELDSQKRRLHDFRNSLKGILERIKDIDRNIDELGRMNRKIFQMSSSKRDRHERNRLLVDKMENENRILQLKQIRKTTMQNRESDILALETMTSRVDSLQKKYDEQIDEFKTKIGLNQKTVENLMVGIYNRFQDEILGKGK